MITDAQQREAARQFVMKWTGRGDEEKDDRSYWLDILIRILGYPDATDRIDFQKNVIINGNSKRMDGYIPETKTIIEQKSLGIGLDQKIRQSDGSELTPYEQAKRYNDNLPTSEKAKWIVTSNFAEIWIYDMDVAVPKPVKMKLADIQTKYSMLDFLLNKEEKTVTKEVEVSKQAGELVGRLYDALLPRYKHPDDPKTLESLNALCVRIVFCLYAEDAGIFGRKSMFHDYLARFDAHSARAALQHLFKVLDETQEQRDATEPYLKDDDPLLAEFPYVNGGLFRDESVEVPPFTDEILDIILNKASRDFNWSEISPTIFGAVFESTLNPETRRKGGMHYTSIENIHKVIDPLFLDDLKKELDEISNISELPTKKKRLQAYQRKLASLTFLDPACGSGNFLTETYLSLRRLENKVIQMLISMEKKEKKQMAGQVILGVTIENPIKVSIQQFYGIEINDFAVTVAKTALWIAESQMMQETEQIIFQHLDFLPLTTNANIIKKNALGIDWNSVIPAYQLNYIMGNPPFVGSARLSDPQKQDRAAIFNGKGGELDYVACWYKKAAEYIHGYPIRCAFVSTNSICQGQQVYPLWKPLMESGITINFAYKTFVWDSEAAIKAHVYCIIVGFSYQKSSDVYLFDNGKKQKVSNINAYLLDAPNVFIERRRKPLGNVPAVIKGFQPTDNGYLILSDAEKTELLSKDPAAEQWIRPFVTAWEFIHGESRFCLWLHGMTPAELNRHPMIKARVQACYDWRNAQRPTGDAYKLRNAPMFMRPTSKFKEGDFIVLPRHSGERRRYIPFGFMKKGCIPGDSVSIVPEASIYLLGVLSSNVHMAWMRTVCGRLEMRYRYSADIVYNNFPWPDPTPEQKATIEKTAQEILDARAKYPDSSLADLYDPLTMPQDLQKAHSRNDYAVMKAYGFDVKTMSEADCVAALMKMYQELTASENQAN